VTDAFGSGLQPFVLSDEADQTLNKGSGLQPSLLSDEADQTLNEGSCSQPAVLIDEADQTLNETHAPAMNPRPGSGSQPAVLSDEVDQILNEAFLAAEETRREAEDSKQKMQVMLAEAQKAAEEMQSKQVAQAIVARFQDFLRAPCLVCYEEEARIVCVPCGHVCMCAHCAVGVKSTSDKCILCRSRIHRYQEMAGSTESTALEEPQVLAVAESLKEMMQDAPMDRMIKYIFNVNVLFRNCQKELVRRALKATNLGKVLSRISTENEDEQVRRLAHAAVAKLKGLVLGTR